MDDVARGVLHGTRVLDLTRSRASAYGTMLLADHGAEVIKIGAEPDQTHDIRLDRNKKSVALDLETDLGRSAMRALATTAAVMVDDGEPGAIDRLGLSYEALAEGNPALIYAALSDADTPSDQTQIQAAGAAMAFGIIASLRDAEASGRGQQITLAMSATDNPVQFSATPMPAAHPAPKFGEHTEAYLAEMPRASLSDVEKRAMRDGFGCFATGVTIVTTRQEDGTPRGFTANSFTSVSLDPPLLLVCIDKRAHSCSVFASAPHFAVNILSEEQKALSNLFASQSTDKFAESNWRPGVADMPIFDEGLASFVCAREKVVEAGDHSILIGRVVDLASRAGQPLGYLRGNYFSVGLEQELIDAASHGTDIEIGALIEDEGRILLAVSKDGGLEVPKAPGPTPSIDTLKTRFRVVGLTVEPDFLYAIYRNSSTGVHTIVYHGTATGVPPQGHRYVAIDALPLSRIRSAPERSMLERFADEFKHGSFGIYHGDETRGTVHRVAAREPSKF